MDFAFTDEQEELRASVRRFFESFSSEQDVRRLMMTEEGFDPDCWKRMAGDLGLQGLVIPEEHGGSGASWVELGIVLEEMGRALFCGPFLSTVVLAATVLLESGDAAALARYLPGIAAGETKATLAVYEASGRWDEAGVETTALPDGDGWALSGTKRFVLDGTIADLVLVPARTDAGVELFAVAGDASGLTRTPQPVLDLTRKLAELQLDLTPAVRIDTTGAAWDVIERSLDLALIGLAAEQVGAAQAAMGLAVAYAKERVQFGQPIGTFQAVKHKCADMFLEVESATSAVYYALRAAAERTEELPAVASLVKAYASDAFVLAAHDDVQIHGGIGVTWEASPHLYFKRAKSTELLFGDPITHRERLARHLGL